MRTLLTEVKLIDDHLLNRASTEDSLLFDAMRIINPALDDQIMWQKKSHVIIQQYGRKKLKAEIESVHRQLFNDTAHQSFRQKIMRLFFNR